jgi:hypothetical protein
MLNYLFNKIILFILITGFYAQSCSVFKPESKTVVADTLLTNSRQDGYALSVHFTKGREHNYPLFAIWIEDTSGNYIQTLYVAESIAKGYFDYGESDKGKWKPGPIRRPAALPYWAHKRGVKTDSLYVPSQEHPMPDAVTGATPDNNFVLHTKTKKLANPVFKVFFEINQSWDWNAYWTNNKYLDNQEYKTSSQPALVYSATVNATAKQKTFPLHVIGHSHYSGATGELFTDISTLTTALEIVDSVVVVVK